MLQRNADYSLSSRPRSSLFWGAVVMLVGGFLLGWIPFLGAFIAGLIGGRIAGTSGRGLLAALLPTMIMAIVILLLHGPFGILFGIAAAVGLLVYTIFHSLALIAGALIGGAL